MVGLPGDTTGSYKVSMLLASGFMLASAVCILWSPRAADRLILARR